MNGVDPLRSKGLGGFLCSVPIQDLEFRSSVCCLSNNLYLDLVTPPQTVPQCFFGALDGDMIYMHSCASTTVCSRVQARSLRLSTSPFPPGICAASRMPQKLLLNTSTLFTITKPSCPYHPKIFVCTTRRLCSEARPSAVKDHERVIAPTEGHLGDDWLHHIQ